MADHQIYDMKTGAPAGMVEIPDDVIAAALLVSRWLNMQPQPAQICGLCQVGQATAIHNLFIRQM